MAQISAERLLALQQLVADIELPRNEDTLRVEKRERYDSPMRTPTLRMYLSNDDVSDIKPGFYVFIQAFGRCNGCGVARGHLYPEFCQKVDKLFDETPEEHWSQLSLDEIFNSFGISRLQYCCRHNWAFPKIYTYNWLDKKKLSRTLIQTTAMKNCPINILNKPIEMNLQEFDEDDEEEIGDQEFVSTKIRHGLIVKTVPSVHELMA